LRQSKCPAAAANTAASPHLQPFSRAYINKFKGEEGEEGGGGEREGGREGGRERYFRFSRRPSFAAYSHKESSHGQPVSCMYFKHSIEPKITNKQ
jgi:hypothetical protein